MNCPIEDLIGSRNEKRGWKEEGYGHDRANERGADKLQKTGEMGGENPNWLKELQSQGKIFRKLKPDCKIEDLFKAYPTLQLIEIRIGRPGTCKNYHMFGECKRKGCTFKHTFLNAPADRLRKAAGVMKAFTNTLH